MKKPGQESPNIKQRVWDIHCGFSSNKPNNHTAPSECAESHSQKPFFYPNASSTHLPFLAVSPAHPCITSDFLLTQYFTAQQRWKTLLSEEERGFTLLRQGQRAKR